MTGTQRRSAAESSGTVYQSNPFSTKMVRPGVLPYRFPPGMTASRLVDRLAATNWWGEIIGPHGSGKSTLLCELQAELCQRGRQTVQVKIRVGQRRLTWRKCDTRSWNSQTAVVVDGFEQLWLPARNWLKRRCRQAGAGLLVTAHQTVGLPRLWRSDVTSTLAWQLVETLMKDHSQVIGPTEVASALGQHDGNLREVFFELYDRFEERASE